MQKNTTIYIHGFNGDGIGPRVEAVRKGFPDFHFSAKDYPANPDLVVREVKQLIESAEGKVFLIAPSLGGFYAWYFSAMYDLPCFLLNPSLRPHITLDDRGIGTFQTWTKQRKYVFKKSYLEKLRLMKEAATSKVKQKNLHFFLAKDDEILDHSPTPFLYPNAVIHWYETGGHRLPNMKEIVGLIRGYIE